jgi:hypothetical protein
MIVGFTTSCAAPIILKLWVWTLFMARYTWYNNMWLSLSVTSDRSVVFSGCSSFLLSFCCISNGLFYSVFPFLFKLYLLFRFFNFSTFLLSVSLKLRNMMTLFKNKFLLMKKNFFFERLKNYDLFLWYRKSINIRLLTFPIVYPPRYNENFVESGVKHHKPKTHLFTLSFLFLLKMCFPRNKKKNVKRKRLVK